MKFSRKKEIYQAELHTICCRFCAAALSSKHKGLSRGWQGSAAGTRQVSVLNYHSHRLSSAPNPSSHVLQTEEQQSYGCASFPQISAQGPRLNEFTPVREIRSAHLKKRVYVYIYIYIYVCMYVCAYNLSSLCSQALPTIKLIQTLHILYTDTVTPVPTGCSDDRYKKGSIPDYCKPGPRINSSICR